MAKIGRFVTDPRAGAYCRMTLDSGEKIVVNHDKGGFKGGTLTVEELTFLGLSSRRLFACSLDGDEGRAVLAQLTRAAAAHGAEATPLGAFVAYLKDCRSVADVKAACARLGTARSPGPAG